MPAQPLRVPAACDAGGQRGRRQGNADASLVVLCTALARCMLCCHCFCQLLAILNEYFRLSQHGAVMPDFSS